MRRPREDHRPADEYSVPISELEIPKVFYSISDKTREFIKRLMDNRARGLSIEGDSNLRVNITPNDFFSLPEDASDDNLLRFCKNMLDVEEIDEKVIEKLSRCLVPAKDFLQNYLHISSFPKELRDLQEIKSREKLLKILRKTRALKSHSKGFSPLYCALLKTMFAEWLYEGAEFQSLVSEGKYLYEKTFEEDKCGVKRFHNIRALSDKWDMINIVGDDFSVRANATYRDKEHDRCLCKFLKKPEEDIVKANTDGIGMRYETDNKDDACRLLRLLIEYLTENYAANESVGEELEFEVEHTHFFDDEEASKEFSSRLQKLSKEKNIRITCEANTNPNINKNFEALSVKIKLHLPQNGIEGGMLRERPVEIQIVEKGNKNELKYSRHEVYEAVQKLSVFTRLFGAFSEKYLDVICQEASDNIERSGFSKGQSVDGALSAENIKDYILREHISKVCISGSKKPRYVADEQFCRLEIADLVPKQIRRRTKSE